VRLGGAAHKDRRQAVEDGKFRGDLYFRLCVICLRVPSLRERAEDIPALAEHFLRQLTRDSGRRMRLSAAALKRMQQDPWPGNVRQLRAGLESLVILNNRDVLDVDDLARHLWQPPLEASDP